MKIKSLVSFLLTVTMLATCFAGITMVTAEVEGDFEYTFEGDAADALEVLKKVVGKVQLFPAEQLTIA